MLEFCLRLCVFSLSVFILLAQPACQIQHESTSADLVSTNKDSNLTKATVINATPIPSNEKTSPPITIGTARLKGVKPPLKVYSISIEFKKQRDDFTWLIMRSAFDKPLNKNDRFTPVDYFKIPFQGFEYNGEKNQEKAVIVHFFGEDSFQAIRPSANGSIKFESFLIESNSDISEFEVWEVRKLLVNGKTPLEDWLPYNTLSNATKDSLDDQDQNGKILDFVENTKTKRTDYPKEAVKFIVAEGVQKWILPVKIKEADIN